MATPARKPEGSTTHVSPQTPPIPSRSDETAARTEGAYQRANKPVLDHSTNPRCNMPECNHRIPPYLRHITCKCERVFCSSHRLPEDHRCTFDHKKHGIEQLAHQLKNPKTRHGLFGNAGGTVR